MNKKKQKLFVLNRDGHVTLHSTKGKAHHVLLGWLNKEALKIMGMLVLSEEKVSCQKILELLQTNKYMDAAHVYGTMMAKWRDEYTYTIELTEVEVDADKDSFGD